MDLHLSLTGKKRITEEVYRQLRAAILSGRLRPGDRLPASRDLARQLAISRTTVNVAYETLIAEGYAEARVGSGTFVSAAVEGMERQRLRRRGPLHPLPRWTNVKVPEWRPAEYDFRTGVPDAQLFPFSTWRRLLAHELQSVNVGRNAYDLPEGDPRLRQAVAAHIAVSRGVVADPEQVIATTGTQQALDLVARIMVRPGDVVAIEDPGYPAARRVFELAGARIAGVPVDTDGLIVDQLPPESRLVVVTPSHQWPLGVPMSLARRLALLRWASEREVAIVEDDYDTEFRFAGRPIEPLHLLDNGTRVIYLGTFSKTLLATLRLGFMIVPNELVAASRAAKSVTDRHTSQLLQRALARMLDDGSFGRHLRKTRTVYRARRERLIDSVEQEFKGHLTLLPASAGLHVSATTPSLSAAEVAAIVGRAARAGVAVQALADYAIGPVRHIGLMLGYGAVALDDIEEGMRRLRRCFAGPR